MGLLKHLLFWPVTGPSYLTRFSLSKVEGAVRTEVTDDAPVKRALMELQMQLELGDIDDEEYVEREAELMLELREVRRWREEFGMATSGGLVRVAEDARDDTSEAAPEPAAPGATPSGGTEDRRTRDGGVDGGVDADAEGRPGGPAPSDSEAEEEGKGKGPSVAKPGAAEVDIILDFDED